MTIKQIDLLMSLIFALLRMSSGIDRDANLAEAKRVCADLYRTASDYHDSKERKATLEA